MERWFNIQKSVNVIHHVNKLKRRKKHMTISLDGGKAFLQSLTSFHDKVLERLGILGTYRNIIKSVYSKPIARIELNGEILKVIPLKSGTR